MERVWYSAYVAAIISSFLLTKKLNKRCSFKFALLLSNEQPVIWLLKELNNDAYNKFVHKLYLYNHTSSHVRTMYHVDA